MTAKSLAKTSTSAALATLLVGAVALTTATAHAQDNPNVGKETPKGGGGANKGGSGKKPAQLTEKQKEAIAKAQAEALKRREAAKVRVAAAQADLKAKRDAAIARAKAWREAAAAKRQAQLDARRGVKPVTPKTPDVTVPTPSATAVPQSFASKRQLIRHFRTTLSEHGQWITSREYGRLWVPDVKEVGKNFSPYRTNGRWALNDDGQWAWVSGYEWGRIPFHYGRWAWAKNRAGKSMWGWSAGAEHAPAWVVWRFTPPDANGKQPARPRVGWAPIPPPKRNFGRTLNWRRRLRRPNVRKPHGPYAFVFVPSARLFSPAIEKHLIKNPSIAKSILAESKLFPGHAGSGGAILSGSPSLFEAGLPQKAIPKLRLAIDAPEVAPFAITPHPRSNVKGGVLKDPWFDKRGRSRFATPPNDAVDAKRKAAVPFSEEDAKKARKELREMRARQKELWKRCIAARGAAECRTILRREPDRHSAPPRKHHQKRSGGFAPMQP